MQCAPEAAKILSQYGAEKHQRNSISVLIKLLCTLDSRLFSAGASRILVHALHATRLGRTNFPKRWTFFSVTVWLSWIFCTLNWSQDFVLFRGLHENFGGSSSWSILNQLSCIFKVATECLVTLLCAVFTSASGSTVHQSDGASKHIFRRIHRKMELCNSPFRPAPRLRSFLSSLSSNYFPFSVSLKPETSWLFNSLRFTPSGRALEFQSMVSSGIKKFRTENWETVWDLSHFGSRSVVVLITIFYYGSHRTCLHRNISRNSERQSFQGIEHSLLSCRRRRLWICTKRFPIYHAYPYIRLQILVAA